jgi:hypothetical protein
MPQERASFEELLEFANKVREAGGGNPLDALMPSVPEDPTACLIARNLNFNCSVAGADYGFLESLNLPLDDQWVMIVHDEDLARKIAEAIGTTYGWNKEDRDWQIILPKEIGRVASEFDSVQRDITRAYVYMDVKRAVRDMQKSKRQRLKEFAPYIEASVKEAHALASIVNDDGSIVV